MARIVCHLCNVPCHYQKDKWWSCPNGHGQRIDAAEPTQEECLQPVEEVHFED